jgi:hypothetical protein
MMNRSLRVIAALVGAACVLGLGLARAPVALASSGGNASAVITDCRDHGKLTQTYTVVALRTALATMPADVAQYTDCQDVIQTSLNAAIHSPSGVATVSGDSGGSFLPTWLIVLLVLLALAAAAFGAMAVRRRRGA